MIEKIKVSTHKGQSLVFLKYLFGVRGYLKVTALFSVLAHGHLKSSSRDISAIRSPFFKRIEVASVSVSSHY